MTSNYSRMVGGPFQGHNEMHLRECSMRMKDIPKNRRGRPRLGDLAPSGMVYLGQFLDHDLTRDETRLEHASNAPEKTTNLRIPRLNLESVYGGGPRRSSHLYDRSEVGSEIFLLGQTSAVPKRKIVSTPDDFYRRNGRPVLADERNDQHLIIAQLHVGFLQFHNRLVEHLKRNEFTEHVFPNENIFDTARRLTVWHYQWIIRNEFLRWFILPEILRDIETHGTRFFKPAPGNEVTLPIEFT